MSRCLFMSNDAAPCSALNFTAASVGNLACLEIASCDFSTVYHTPKCDVTLIQTSEHSQSSSHSYYTFCSRKLPGYFSKHCSSLPLALFPFWDYSWLGIGLPHYPVCFSLFFSHFPWYHFILDLYPSAILFSILKSLLSLSSSKF